ncbi:hypothetical protein J6590_026108 [Homalodisca vitripennis]|nr:hypothetical protein J6590_026108 [Homalodisca vitripennis]
MDVLYHVTRYKLQHGGQAEDTARHCHCTAGRLSHTQLSQSRQASSARQARARSSAGKVAPHSRTLLAHPATPPTPLTAREMAERISVLSLLTPKRCLNAHLFPFDPRTAFVCFALPLARLCPPAGQATFVPRMFPSLLTSLLWQQCRAVWRSFAGQRKVEFTELTRPLGKRSKSELLREN